MMGNADFYAKLPEGSGSRDHKDELGQSWDLKLPSMFHFLYVKDSSAPSGFLLKRTEVYADTFPAIQEMMKRGLIKQ